MKATANGHVPLVRKETPGVVSNQTESKQLHFRTLFPRWKQANDRCESDSRPADESGLRIRRIEQLPWNFNQKFHVKYTFRMGFRSDLREMLFDVGVGIVQQIDAAVHVSKVTDS